MGKLRTSNYWFKSKKGIVVPDTADIVRGTLFEDIKNVFNNHEVKKLVRMTNAVSEAAAPFIESPTFMKGVVALTNVGKILVEDVEVYSHGFFMSDEWVEVFSREFNGTLMTVLGKLPFKKVVTSEENTIIKVVDLNGCQVGWTINSKVNSVEHIYFQTDKVDEAKVEIKRRLWDMYGGKPIVMKKNRTIVASVGGTDDRVLFDVDSEFVTVPSLIADANIKKLKRSLDAGVNRSVMLFGSPGTGKSTIARTIVAGLGLRSFRIRVEDVSSFDNSSIVSAVEIFQPEAIIIDDFDRVVGQASLLEMLTFFQQHVKLVITTVNDKEKLDAAILRPERVDELIPIEAMDEASVRVILGQYADECFEQVKSWPIVFIQEYMKRRKYMEPDEIVASMKELSERVDQIGNKKAYSDSWLTLTGKEPKESSTDDDDEEEEEEASS